MLSSVDLIGFTLVTDTRSPVLESSNESLTALMTLTGQLRLRLEVGTASNRRFSGFQAEGKSEARHLCWSSWTNWSNLEG
jgi:hypothetical protein